MKPESLLARIKRVIELWAIWDISQSISDDAARKARRALSRALASLYQDMTLGQGFRLEEIVRFYGEKWAVRGATRTIRRGKRDAADKAARSVAL